MKLGNGCWILPPLALLAAPALAANKCVDAGGRISYQAAPCPAAARGGDMSLNINRPFTGQVKKPSPAGTAATTTGNENSPINATPDRAAPSGKDAER